MSHADEWTFLRPSLERLVEEEMVRLHALAFGADADRLGRLAELSRLLPAPSINLTDVQLTDNRVGAHISSYHHSADRHGGLAWRRAHETVLFVNANIRQED
ncbi:unnamed protein product [Protopolystoma xenopodis]|uniref:Uncharacterized protein n=1 Tax=Protopolystoma xenopodis TaxID=117903 RepID=A0A3S5AGP8_9PLAT|nr:unnamed protein product [Protopolystoma xenopodis]